MLVLEGWDAPVELTLPAIGNELREEDEEDEEEEDEEDELDEEEEDDEEDEEEEEDEDELLLLLATGDDDEEGCDWFVAIEQFAPIQPATQEQVNTPGTLLSRHTPCPLHRPAPPFLTASSHVVTLIAHCVIEVAPAAPVVVYVLVPLMGWHGMHTLLPSSSL